MKTKLIIHFLVLLSLDISLACSVSRSLLETHFSIDPATGRTQLESKVNNAQFQIERCASEQKYLLINFNALYFQDDTSRLESISGNLVQTKSNCSIETELPFKKLDENLLLQTVSDRSQFLRQCVRIRITDQRGGRITTHPQSKCQLSTVNQSGSVLQTDGNGCLFAITPYSQLLLEQSINPECLNSQYLNNNKIQAGDYESVLKIWPVTEELQQLAVQSPIGLRYIRHTLLPAQGFMPRAATESKRDMPFVSAMSTNISPGNIIVQSMGKNIYQFQPTFLVENISKEFCNGSECARPSSFVTPIAGLMKLYKYNKKKNSHVQIAQWAHAIRVPANWSGLAEFKFENNLSGTTMGSWFTETKPQAGDEYSMSAEFYEPRTLIDELMNTNNYMELNNDLNVQTTADDNTLPNLPKIGQLGKIGELPQLPQIALGMSTIAEWSDQFNMLKNWTHTYDRVCNYLNLNCFKLDGLNKSFVTIRMNFKLGENLAVIPVGVEKKSPVFENYKQPVSHFAKKVCL